MKSPSWLQGYVESLDIQPMGRYRSDCPVCGKKNTFSVNDDGMQRLWFCFHADCNVSGRTGIKLTRDFAKLAMKKQDAKNFKRHLTVNLNCLTLLLAFLVT
jgi:phage/plasmid primase-like uncharacterized protein